MITELINGTIHIRFDCIVPVIKKSSIDKLNDALKECNAVITKMEFDNKWYYLHPRLNLTAYVPEHKAAYFSNY